MVDADQMRDAALKYFASFASADVESIVSLFAENATIEDPVGGPPVSGHDGIRQFFSGGFAFIGGGYTFAPEGAVRIAGNHAAVAAIATCDKADPPFWLETLDVFEFDDAGKIVSMKAYWGPTNMHSLSGDPEAARRAAERAQGFVDSLG